MLTSIWTAFDFNSSQCVSVFTKFGFCILTILMKVTEISIWGQLSLHHKNSCLSHIYTSNSNLFDRMMRRNVVFFLLSLLNFCHFILPTLSSLLGHLSLQLQLPHDGGGGGDGGAWRQEGDTRRHSGGDLVWSETPPNQLKVDSLACVSEHFHCLLIGVSLDVNAIDLQRAIIYEPAD